MAPRVLATTPKVAFGVAVVPWAILYWRAHGPENFLWFCDLANFLVAFALLTESSLLLSSQGGLGAAALAIGHHSIPQRFSR